MISLRSVLDERTIEVLLNKVAGLTAVPFTQVVISKQYTTGTVTYTLHIQSFGGSDTTKDKLVNLFTVQPTFIGEVDQ